MRLVNNSHATNTTRGPNGPQLIVLGVCLCVFLLLGFFVGFCLYVCVVVVVVVVLGGCCLFCVCFLFVCLAFVGRAVVFVFKKQNCVLFGCFVVFLLGWGVVRSCIRVRSSWRMCFILTSLIAISGYMYRE